MFITQKMTKAYAQSNPVRDYIKQGKTASARQNVTA